MTSKIRTVESTSPKKETMFGGKLCGEYGQNSLAILLDRKLRQHRCFHYRFDCYG